MTHDGTNSLTYDANGNMTSDGVNSYAWDRANRLLSMGGISYAYSGDGNRIQQDALQYILDLQPGLAQVIGDSDGNRYVHSPRGIHAVSDGSAWTYPLTDALGSVRGYADENGAVLSNVNYSPTGVPDVVWDGWAFTGEWRSENETQYHRARHLSPGLGGSSPAPGSSAPRLRRRWLWSMRASGERCRQFSFASIAQNLQNEDAVSGTQRSVCAADALARTQSSEGR